ncbi:MAG TPA: hypothetical protein VI564_04660 [Candidatus Nanoarchaeia archaeon]|nr:hypothetical protein [Candidatus Nanoarchaeia archaeon]
MRLSKREKRKFRQEAGQGENIADEEVSPVSRNTEAKPKKSKFFAVLVVAGILLFAIIAYSAYSYFSPGPYDNFAKCLSEKGAVMYGAMGWCKFTQGQKAMFGKSFKNLNYKEHTELPGIKKTPTWVINGVWYENAQSFDKLSAITGCKI